MRSVNADTPMTPKKWLFGARFYTGTMEQIKGLLRSAIITSAASICAAIIVIILID